MALEPGTTVAGYRIERLLGRGGMGEVYLASQLICIAPVALKLQAPFLYDDRSFRERFVRESELAASLDHPNVVPIYEAGETDGQLFLAMRHVAGTDLDSLLDGVGAVEPERALAIVGGIAAALDAAHAAGPFIEM
jgi:serine/threonine protein kinase